MPDDFFKVLFIQDVVEAYRLDRYDNSRSRIMCRSDHVVEAYRLDRYDNLFCIDSNAVLEGCRSLSFG